jgi:MFS family permease
MKQQNVHTRSARARRLEVLRSGRFVGGIVVALLFMGSSLLTPLYELYSSIYRLDALGLTLIYAVYVIGNLTALLFFGRLSDQLGRRPIILIGLALAALSNVLFLVAGTSGWLFAGRIVSGCAVGIGSGAATAWIAESTPKERRPLAASTMTAFNFAGLTLGPIVAGTLVQYAPWPLRLPFLAYLGLIAIVALLVFAARETLDRASTDRLSLRPRLGVPAGARLGFAAPAAAGFVAMATVGYYAALGPTMIHQTINVTNRALSGAIVAELFAIAAIVILLTRRLEPRRALLAGLIVAPFGLATLAAVQAWPSLPLMLVGTMLSGIAAALSYRGGLGVVNALAPPDRRAELASAYFICCFLGNALPIVGVGALSERLGPAAADRILAIGLSILATGALGAALLFKGSDRAGA